MIDASCYKCEKRYPGCHDNCEDYKRYMQDRRAKEDVIRKAREKERRNQAYIREHFEEIKKKRGKKK